MDPRQVIHDKNYADRQRKAGMKQVQVWVPAARAQELRNMASKMRAEERAKS